MILAAVLGIVQENAYKFWSSGAETWSEYVNWMQTKSPKSRAYRVVLEKVI